MSYHVIVQRAVMAVGLIAYCCCAVAESRAAEETGWWPAVLILNEYNWPPQIKFERSNFQRIMRECGFVYEYGDQANFVARHNSDLPALLGQLKKFNLVVVVGAPEYDVAHDRVPALSAALGAALVEHHRLGGGLFFMPTTGGYEHLVRIVPGAAGREGPTAKATMSGMSL